MHADTPTQPSGKRPRTRRISKLTDATIRQALKDATVRTEIADALAVGLRLRIAPGGSRAVWVLAIKDRQRKARRFKVGEYPVMGLAKAREEARTLRADVSAKGKDPVEEARQRRAWGVDAQQGVGTLGAIITAYGNTPKGKQKSWEMAEYRIRHVFKRHVDEPIGTLTREGLQATAQAHKGPYASAAAVRALRPVLKWAIKHHHLNPDATDLTPPATPQRRDRVLSKKELAIIVPALRCGGSHDRAMLFMLLTLARREEVATATWGDVDLARAEWTITKQQAKNSVEHKVPLSRQAVTLLGKEGDPEALLFATATGGRLSNWDRATARVIKATHKAEPDTEKKSKEEKAKEKAKVWWTRHDLRRTGATMLGGALVEPHVIEAALNHASIHSLLAATYNKAKYFPAVKVALQGLADEIDEIAKGAPAPGATTDTGAEDAA